MRPYRVGMSCGFCHVGPEPDRAAGRSREPEVGEPQLERRRAVLLDRPHLQPGRRTRRSFMFQLFHTSRPGALDTSLVSTDYINNPRTMNAIYNLGAAPRGRQALGQGDAGGRRADNKQFNDYVNERAAHRVLPGAGHRRGRRACSRTASTRWARWARSTASTSTSACSARSGCCTSTRSSAASRSRRSRSRSRAENSTYWQATEAQTPDMALFFLKPPRPHRLKDAPGGDGYLTQDPARARRAARSSSPSAARAATRARCPSRRPGVDPGGCAGPGLPDCWNKYWEWTKTDEFKAQDAGDRAGRRLPRRQLPVHRAARAGDAAARPTPAARSRPTRSPATSGTTSPRSPTRTCRRSARSRCTTRSPASPGSTRCRPAAAATRARLADQPLVDRAVPAEQHARAVRRRAPRSRRGWRSFEDSHRADALAGEAGQGPGAGRQGAGVIDRTAGRSYIRIAAGYLPDDLKPLLGSLNRYAPWLVGRGRHRDRADSGRHAGEPDRQRRPHAGWR